MVLTLFLRAMLFIRAWKLEENDKWQTSLMLIMFSLPPAILLVIVLTEVESNSANAVIMISVLISSLVYTLFPILIILSSESMSTFAKRRILEWCQNSRLNCSRFRHNQVSPTQSIQSHFYENIDVNYINISSQGNTETIHVALLRRAVALFALQATCCV